MSLLFSFSFQLLIGFQSLLLNGPSVVGVWKCKLFELKLTLKWENILNQNTHTHTQNRNRMIWNENETQSTPTQSHVCKHCYFNQNHCVKYTSINNIN